MCVRTGQTGLFAARTIMAKGSLPRACDISRRAHRPENGLSTAKGPQRGHFIVRATAGRLCDGVCGAVGTNRIYRFSDPFPAKGSLSKTRQRVGRVQYTARLAALYNII